MSYSWRKLHSPCLWSFLPEPYALSNRFTYHHGMFNLLFHQINNGSNWKNWQCYVRPNYWSRCLPAKGSVAELCVRHLCYWCAPATNVYKTNINTGGASAPIDHYAMRINHLAFSLKNKIYIFNVWNVLTHMLAPRRRVMSGGEQAPSHSDVFPWTLGPGRRSSGPGLSPWWHI